MYKSFFDYDSRVPEQKKVLDEFYKNQQTVFQQQDANILRYTELSSMSENDLM